jgi:hypothetical protein
MGRTEKEPCGGEVQDGQSPSHDNEFVFHGAFGGACLIVTSCSTSMGRGFETRLARLFGSQIFCSNKAERFILTGACGSLHGIQEGMTVGSAACDSISGLWVNEGTHEEPHFVRPVMRRGLRSGDPKARTLLLQSGREGRVRT